MSKSKIIVRISAVVDVEEFTTDKEDLPEVLEDTFRDLLHENAGIETRNINIKVLE